MTCHETSCPFYVLREARCGLLSNRDREVEDRFTRDGSFAAALTIEKVLAGKRQICYSAKSTCMYPCLKHGDILHVECYPIDASRVGDVAVISRNGVLYGHRIISKGVDDVRGVYIVTRPDRSFHGNDGPTWEDGFIGIVTGAERNGKSIPLNPKKLTVIEFLRVSSWEWLHWKAKPAIARYVYYIQRQALYGALVSFLLRMRYPKPFFSVLVPLKPMQLSNLCQVFTVADMDLRTIQQMSGTVVEWTIQMELQKKIPAARITLVNRPECCPDGGGWHIQDKWTRSRYYGAGLETRLIEEARKIIRCSGASLESTTES